MEIKRHNFTLEELLISDFWFTSEQAYAFSKQNFVKLFEDYLNENKLKDIVSSFVHWDFINGFCNIISNYHISRSFKEIFSWKEIGNIFGRLFICLNNDNFMRLYNAEDLAWRNSYDEIFAYIRNRTCENVIRTISELQTYFSSEWKTKFTLYSISDKISENIDLCMLRVNSEICDIIEHDNWHYC
jgi:hypothetical protein